MASYSTEYLVGDIFDSEIVEIKEVDEQSAGFVCTVRHVIRG